MRLLPLSLFCFAAASLIGFPIHRAIVSADDNPLYLDFWPLVAKTWKAIGIQPTLALIAEEGCPIDASLGDVVRFDPIPGISKAMQAQVYRLFLPCLFPEEVCLISDIDMIPVSKSYFVEGAACCPEEAFLIYRDAALPPPQYPMCYVAGKGRVFSAIFQVAHPDQFPARLRAWKMEEDSWYADQVLLFRAVNSWELFEGGEVVRLGHGVGPRLDRPEWKQVFSPEELEAAIDCHCARPYSQFKESIDRIAEYVIQKYED